MIGVWCNCIKSKGEYLKLILYNSLSLSVITKNRKEKTKICLNDGPKFLDMLYELIDLPAADFFKIIREGRIEKDEYFDILQIITTKLTTTKFTELIEWIKGEY